MTDDEMRDDMLPDEELLSAEDARLAALLEREARGYHAPPATAPRDAMWGEIRARLDGAHAGVTPITAAPSRRRSWSRHTAWGAVAAAALIFGVGIGRVTGRGPQPVLQAPAQVAAAAPSAAESTVVAITAPSLESPNESGAPRSTRTAAAPAAPGTGVSRGRTATGATSPAYRDAAAIHLAAAEALLVSLRSPSDGAAGDTAVSKWAGDLLGTTRILLDSPAARDARTRKLLEDLELVLAQIARLRPDAPADGRGVSDRELIDKAIRERQMLTRLRAAGA